MCCLCCWVTCWLLQDMDDTETSCVFYVTVGLFDQLEQCKICILTDTTLQIVMLTIKYDSIFSICFMEHPWEFFRQTSSDVHSVKEFPLYIWQTWHFGSCWHQLIPVSKHTTSDRNNPNCRMNGKPHKLQQYAAGFTLGRSCKVQVNHSILISS